MSVNFRWQAFPSSYNFSLRIMYVFKVCQIHSLLIYNKINFTLIFHRVPLKHGSHTCMTRTTTTRSINCINFFIILPFGKLQQEIYFMFFVFFWWISCFFFIYAMQCIKYRLHWITLSLQMFCVCCRNLLYIVYLQINMNALGLNCKCFIYMISMFFSNGSLKISSNVNDCSIVRKNIFELM